MLRVGHGKLNNASSEGSIVRWEMSFGQSRINNFRLSRDVDWSEGQEYYIFAVQAIRIQLING